MRLAVIPPRCHDRNILDITMNLYTYPTIIIAHRLGVFEFMSKSPRNINDISTELQIKKRPAEAIMATLRALNLVELNAGLFRLTSEAQEFLLKGSPNYFGYFWDMMYENSENFSLKNLESAIRKDTAQVYRERALFDTHAHDTEKARKFTHAMHSLSMGSASVWPTALSLASHRKALDIGGASGAHAIGMAAHWPTSSAPFSIYRRFAPFRPIIYGNMVLIIASAPIAAICGKMITPLRIFISTPIYSTTGRRKKTVFWHKKLCVIIERRKDRYS